MTLSGRWVIADGKAWIDIVLSLVGLDTIRVAELLTHFILVETEAI